MSVFTEAPVWRALGDGWRPVWPGFGRHGFSVEWHDFHSDAALDCTGSLHPDSIEICLNLSGHAEFSVGNTRHELPPASALFYVTGRDPISARRLPRQRHQFITVEISRDFLKSRFAGDRDGLHPQIRAALADRTAGSGISDRQRLTAEQQQLIPALRNAPVSPAGRAVWFESKVLGLMADFFVLPEKELFCERQRRVTYERVQRVIELLRGNLAEPPDLLELGRRVGCSPFYLSRTFSQEVGMTIPQYLRQLRMERAAELLRTGKCNVTEAAMEVGYSSLSHFSQAFCQAMGCCPNLYPLLKR